MQNGHVESFNGKVRDECLKPNLFAELDDASTTIEAWRVDYNLHRPHSALRNIPPQAVLDRYHAGPTWSGGLRSCQRLDLSAGSGHRLATRGFAILNCKCGLAIFYPYEMVSTSAAVSEDQCH